MDNEHTLSNCGAGKSQVSSGGKSTSTIRPSRDPVMIHNVRTSRGSNSGLALNYVHIPIYSVIFMLHYMVLGIFIYRILYD